MMSPDEKAALEASGFRVGDFAEFLGMDEAEAQITAHRADLGAAIRRIRLAAGRTQAGFGKSAGVSQAKLARIEVGAPEVSIDLMTRVYLAAGGLLSLGGVRPAGAEVKAATPRATRSRKTKAEA